MDIKALTPHLSITPQVLVAELEAVAQMGFKAIICNRPDGEGPDQPSFKEMEQAALTLGMQIRYLPADAGKVSDEDGKTFGELLPPCLVRCWLTAAPACVRPPCGPCRKPVSHPCRKFWKRQTKWALT
jgi:uncharacterized protein (TIGR01244 family)